MEIKNGRRVRIDLPPDEDRGAGGLVEGTIVSVKELGDRRGDSLQIEIVIRKERKA